MNTPRCIRPLALLVFVLAQPAIGQVIYDEASSAARGQIQNLDAPTATPNGPSSTTKVSATASGDTSGAAGQLSYPVPIQPWHALLANTLSAAAPFSDSNPPKPQLGSVSNLSAGANATLNSELVFFPAQLSSEQNKQFYTEREVACNIYLHTVLGPQYYFSAYSAQHAADGPNYTHDVDQLFNGSCIDLTEPQKLQAFVTALNQHIRKQNAAPGSPNEPLVVLPGNTIDLAKTAAKTLGEIVPPHFSQPLNAFGLTFLGNQHSYSYVLSSAPTKVEKESTEGYGVGVNYSVLFNRASMILGYNYERPYMGGTGQQVCSPIESSSSTSCTSAVVGKPMRTTDRIGSAEVRFLITDSLAVAPRLEYDLANPNLGVLLPVYFVATTKSPLNGGLEVGWTRQAGYQGAVVIQKAFSFLDF
jgi:hypothetical protein